VQIKEVGSGAEQRELRATLIAAARRREIDVVLVWRLDRWGRSVADLVSTLQELQHLGVCFVSLTEALDLTTSTGRARADCSPCSNVRAGLVHARQQRKRLGRPPSVVHKVVEARKLHQQGASKSEIAHKLQIGRTSIRRLWPQRNPAVQRGRGWVLRPSRQNFSTNFLKFSVFRL
jgi:putative DNA-invertase from lambdoid prophage Rac